MHLLVMIIIGLVQGVTEFIPVSSSGHLVLVGHLLSGYSSHMVLEYINIGTLLALLVYFRERIAVIVRGAVRTRQYSLLRNIILTSLPAGIVGLVLADVIAQSPFFGSVLVVVVALTAVGVLMVIAERLPRLSSMADGSKLSWQRALTVGIVQVLALVPGVSRSGSTILAGRSMGLSHREAAEYSFLASIPIMTAVVVKLFIKSSDRAYIITHIPEVIIGNAVAFIAGLAAIGLLMKYLQNNDLKLFGIYRLVLAAVVLGIVLLQ